MSIINPIIIISGATATGKTNAAVTVAQNISGEIISADSMQVYKYMDIGTAKPTKTEMRGIRHYMIDELYPDEEFNVAVFKKMAAAYLRSIQSEGKIPIIAGGTGFYINALIKNTDFAEEASNREIRRCYEALAAERGNAHVYNVLAQKDPASANLIHPNNIKRVIRALEYYDTTGVSIASHNASEKTKTIDSNVLFFILEAERKKLYERIDARVDKMMQEGLINEVRSLLEMGYGIELVSMQGIGYKEMIRHFAGEYSLEGAVCKIKQSTRNYAKRQLTWFKHQTDGIIVDAEAVSKDPCVLCEHISNEIRRRKNVDC